MFYNQADPFPAGKTIITDPNMVDTVVKPRSWRERLFTFPWKPWQKVTITQKPQTIIVISGDKLIMHPDICDKLMESIKEKSKNKFSMN